VRSSTCRSWPSVMTTWYLPGSTSPKPSFASLFSRRRRPGLERFERCRRLDRARRPPGGAPPRPAVTAGLGGDCGFPIAAWPLYGTPVNEKLGTKPLR
jgi:hypothetical protein